ncbi:MAG TPA: hypothetical protein QGF58_25770 [Myxococcota bacterium]|nr:hypothetical protein [Myxococcota bacterium]
MNDGSFIASATAAFQERLVKAVGELRAAQNPAGFCSAERVVHALALEFASSLTQNALQAVSDDEERRKEALSAVREKAASRGVKLEVERHRKKTLVRTLSGAVVEVFTSYARAIPRTDQPLKGRGAQGTGVFPVLDQLGIVGRSTPASRLLVSRAVCEANSVASARELLAASGVEVDHKGALRLTYLVAGDALRHRRSAVRSQTPNDEGELAGRRVVVAVDGGRINIRRRVGGRPKKGGRKRFETEWREPKVLTIYALGEDGKRDKGVRSVIDGTLGDADAVFELMRYHLFRLGAHKAIDVTLIADAAQWIWGDRAEGLRSALCLPPERFHEIVDYFHAVERLGDFAKSRSGWSELMRRSWVKVQKERLKAGDVEGIEEFFASTEGTTGEDLSTERKYWERHRERLRFAAFRKAGLPNGSGAVESAVRRVVNLRLKGASICWTEEHAEGLLHLRAHAKSGRWDELEAAVLGTTGWRPICRQPRNTEVA